MSKLFLAGLNSYEHISREWGKLSPYVLDSFYYFQPWQQALLETSKEFLLDSGAYTFLNSQKNASVDWDKYIDDYARFIYENDIEHFVELDIDSVVGLTQVEKYRSRLEELTGKKTIPVWHKSRGKDYFLQMLKDYDYVAVGGLVTKEIRPSEYKYLPWFSRQARKNKAQIHALGFLRGITEYGFTGADCTSWLGQKFGNIYTFRNGRIKQTSAQQGKRVIHKDTSEHNFREWLKYQNYLDRGDAK